MGLRPEDAACDFTIRARPSARLAVGRRSVLLNVACIDRGVHATICRLSPERPSRRDGQLWRLFRAGLLGAHLHIRIRPSRPRLATALSAYGLWGEGDGVERVRCCPQASIVLASGERRKPTTPSLFGLDLGGQTRNISCSGMVCMRRPAARINYPTATSRVPIDQRLLQSSPSASSPPLPLTSPRPQHPPCTPTNDGACGPNLSANAPSTACVFE